MKTTAPNGDYAIKRLRRDRDGTRPPPGDKPPPHDLALERHFLGSCFQYPELILESNLVSSDFYSGAHEVIWSALLHLVADGSPVDTLTMRNHLADVGRLSAAGGDEYINGLTDTIPLKKHDYTRLRRLARQRHLQEAARAVASADADELEQACAMFAAARAELDALGATGPRIPSLADCIAGIAQVGPRLPIGLGTLDDATRGGVPMDRFVSVLGAPGASKTNLSVWLGDRWERAGCAVIVVAADESRESIIVRLGQLDGHDRDLLEGLDDGRRNAFARNSRPRALKVTDPFADKVMLEHLEAELIDLAAGRPRVLIIDSLQRVPSIGAASLETKREQVEHVVEVLDGFAKRGTTVIAISEMSRAGYRTGKRDLDISALAAGAETRAIEYASHLIIGLKPVRGERGIIDLEVGKNRLGPDKPEIRLALNFDTLAFREIEKPIDEDVEKERQKSAGLRGRVLAAVVKSDCRTVTQIIAQAGIRKRDGSGVIRDLIDEGLLAKDKGVYRALPALPDADLPVGDAT